MPGDAPKEYHEQGHPFEVLPQSCNKTLLAETGTHDSKADIGVDVEDDKQADKDYEQSA